MDDKTEKLNISKEEKKKLENKYPTKTNNIAKTHNSIVVLEKLAKINAGKTASEETKKKHS
jgi:hypothetical protein